MTRESSRRRYWREWKAKSLGGGEIADTHAFISQDAHARIVELAAERKERLPAFTGRLVTLALDILDGRSAFDALEKMKAVEGKETIADSPDTAAVGTIADAVLASRFQDDTMSTRFRQVALINIIAKETTRGNTVTANTISAIADGEAGQIRLLARLLTKRGILSMQGAAGVGSGTYAKVMTIRPDALERLSKAHLEETGLPLSSNS